MFNYVPLVYFCFYFHYSSRRFTEDLAVIYVNKSLPMFSSKRFIISGLTFKSLILFEFTFVYGVRKCSNFILLHIAVQLSKHRLLKRLSFLHCIVLPPLSKIWCPQVCEFYLWAFYLVALVYTTIFVPEPYCLNDYSFVV